MLIVLLKLSLNAVTFIGFLSLSKVNELLNDKFFKVSLFIIKLLGSLVIIVNEVFFELNIVAQEQSVKTKVTKIICVMCRFIMAGNEQGFMQVGK